MFDLLKNNPLFKTYDSHLIEKSLMKATFKEVSFFKGDIAFDKNNDQKSLMFLISGSARVEQFYNQETSFLKRLSPGDMFGVLSLFSSDNTYPTRVVFEKNSQVLSLSEEAVLRLLNSDDILLKNYLTFFNGQVHYLLNRIALFSIPNGEERVVSYLARLKDYATDDRVVLPMTKVELADFLGIARSTLYRVLDKLIQSGKIKMEGHTLHILGGIE